MKDERNIIIEDEVSELLLCAGIPANMKGFRYLKTGITLAYKNPELVDRMTTQMYPSIAKCENTKPELVERCIRHCVMRAFESGSFVDIQEFAKKFSSKKPCNGEAIAIFSQILKKRLNQKALMYKNADITSAISYEKYEALRKELDFYRRMYGDFK